MTFGKPIRAARQKKQKERRSSSTKLEKDAKAAVRTRDRSCRFPICGCRRLGLALKARPEVSHSRHKGMGGDPSGARSTADSMVLLCLHRHQQGAVSQHKGTLRPVFLTDKKFDGPIAWEVDRDALWPDQRVVRAAKGLDRWLEVSRELGVRRWQVFTEVQLDVLARLSEMEL